MNWVRWHHGTSTDPKWRVIASKAQVSIAAVLAVWSVMLESASANDVERGTITGWNHEDVAAALDLDADDVERIWDTMQGKVVVNQRLTGWEKRNPKREDSSRERMKRHRESVTHGDAKRRSVTQCDARGEEIREEKNKEEKKPAARRRGQVAPYMGVVTPIWHKHYPDAEPPKGTANALRPLFARLPENEALALLDTHLATTLPHFLNLSKFAATAGGGPKTIPSTNHDKPQRPKVTSAMIDW